MRAAFWLIRADYYFNYWRQHLQILHYEKRHLRPSSLMLNALEPLMLRMILVVSEQKYIFIRSCSDARARGTFHKASFCNSMEYRNALEVHASREQMCTE